MKTIFRVREIHMGDGTINFFPEKLHVEKGDEAILDGLIWDSMWQYPLSTLKEANSVIELFIERHEKKNQVVEMISHPYSKEWEGRI